MQIAKGGIAAAYNLSTASIYNWLNRGWLPFKLTDLPNRNVRQHRVSENRGKFTSGTSIEQRNCERKLNTSKMMISLAFLRILLKRF